MTSREAAHRLWPDHVAADPADDPPPKAKTPNQVMNKLLYDARLKTMTNRTTDPLARKKSET
jgi:hypothetical protein